MTRSDFLQQAADHDPAFPGVRISGRGVVRGRCAWEAFVRLAPVRELNRALVLLQQKAPRLWLWPEELPRRRDIPADVVGRRQAPALAPAETSSESIDDRWLADVIASSTADELWQCRPAVPLEAQQRIVANCIQRSREAGLVLPDVVRVRYVEGRPEIVRGACGRAEDGAIEIRLSVNQWPEELESTSFHELQHAHDLLVNERLSRVELERRAILFASRMMGWR